MGKRQYKRKSGKSFTENSRKRTRSSSCDETLETIAGRFESPSNISPSKSPGNKKRKSKNLDRSVRGKILFDEMLQVDSRNVENDIDHEASNNNATVCIAELHVSSAADQNNQKGDGIDCFVDPGTKEEKLDYDFSEGDFEENSQNQNVNVDSDLEVSMGPMESSANDESLNDEQKLLEQNPGLRNLFNKLLDERIKQAADKGESSQSTLLSTMTPPAKGKSNHKQQSQLVAAKQKVIVQKSVKSPSDTTIYVPALTRKDRTLNDNCIVVGDRDRQNVQGINSPMFSGNNTRNSDIFKDQIMNRISNFVDSIRKELDGANAAEGGADQQVEETQLIRSQISVPGKALA